ncbi:MAG: hypothetical protein IJZ39_05225 [Oscillospiraceae bacterium]|nr:hypothetical protein [Oscillospiraceae bacterium]
MRKKKLDRIIEQIARQEHSTSEYVRREMQRALDEAQASTDPVVQARWKTIPHKGEKATLEEFIEYSAARVNGI